jgi:phosphonate transport system substrate-binding protein
VLNLALFVLRRVALAALFSAAAMPAFAAGTTYTLAVIPAAPPVTMHKLWMPFVDRLSKKTGLAFRLKHYEKMADFEQDIWSGVPDFIFSSPIQLSVAHRSNGYLPLARARKPVAIGLFVRKDSPIRGIDDLHGRKISFVGNKNLCSVAMLHLLAKQNSDLSFDREYVGSTRNVIINVLLGKSDAGSVFLPEMNLESAETRSQLREILKTPEIASHPFSAHPRVPATVQEAVKQAVLAMAAAADGAELLKSLGLETPVAADYGRDYRSLEEMDIKGLTNWGQ